MREVTIHHIDVNAIKPFVHRSRSEAGYERMKESIREVGLHVPIQVRDISDWDAKDRGKYKYQLVAGQGRLQACKELKMKTIPALIVDMPEEDIYARFLSENIMRKRLPWQAKARLMRDDLKPLGNPTKADLEVVAKRYFVTPTHVSKLVKLLGKASPRVQKELDRLTVEEASHLTTLPARGQDIVIETLHETGLPKSDMAAIVRKAREIEQSGKQLSPTELKASIKRDTEELHKITASLKELRHHYENGPVTLMELLSEPKYRKLADAEGIPYQRLEALMETTV